jgi:hypothetical protein
MKARLKHTQKNEWKEKHTKNGKRYLRMSPHTHTHTHTL